MWCVSKYTWWTAWITQIYMWVSFLLRTLKHPSIKYHLCMNLEKAKKSALFCSVFDFKFCNERFYNLLFFSLLTISVLSLHLTFGVVCSLYFESCHVIRFWQYSNLNRTLHCIIVIATFTWKVDVLLFDIILVRFEGGFITERPTLKNPDNGIFLHEVKKRTSKTLHTHYTTCIQENTFYIIYLHTRSMVVSVTCTVTLLL